MTSAQSPDSFRATLLAALAALPPRERRVIEMSFGLYDGLPRRLFERAGPEIAPRVNREWMATRLGITVERFDEIYAKAMESLRRHFTPEQLAAGGTLFSETED